MSSSGPAQSKKERDLDSLLRHIRGVRSLLTEAKSEGSTSRTRMLEKVKLAQSALEKARDDVDHIKRNTLDSEHVAAQTATLQEELNQAKSSFQTEHDKYVKLLEDVRELRLSAETTRAEQAKCSQLQAELSQMKDERDRAAREYTETVTPLMLLPLLSAIANHGSPRLLNASKNPLPTEVQIMALARGPHPVLSGALENYLVQAIRHPSELKNTRNRIAHPQGLTEHGYRSSYARMAEALDHLGPPGHEYDWSSTLPLMESKKSLASARLGNMGVHNTESLSWVDSEYDAEGIHRPHGLDVPMAPRALLQPRSVTRPGSHSSRDILPRPQTRSSGPASSAGAARRSVHVFGGQGTPWSDNESSEDERKPKRKRQQSPSAARNDGRTGLFSYDDE